MTERLYYEDSYTSEFTARVVERLTVEGHPAVVLDRSYFYPEGGGQPCDLGAIAGIAVIGVFSREEDAAVVHVLDDEIESDDVACRIDWPRRFDHMQHHTGQHILTQAFVRVAGASTVGFHLSPDSVTIDLDVPDVAPDVLAQVEDLANQIVYEDRPVTARLISVDDTSGVRIRWMPGHLLTEGLRVIDIESFDVTACGGTHVARTGEIGMIKILRADRRGEETRIEFRCGLRALHDYREKSAILNRLAADLTCSYREIDRAVARLRDDLRVAHRALKAASSQLIRYEAEHLLAHAVQHGDVRVVRAVFSSRNVDEVRALAGQLTQTPGTVALLGTSGEVAHLVFARSSELPHDMSELLRHVLPLLGEARGGGRPGFAQGGGVPATADQVEAVLDQASSGLFSSTAETSDG